MNRLLDVERKRTPSQLWRGSTEIVLVSRDRCLRCGGNVVEFDYGQLPLFRSHGHGTTMTLSGSDKSEHVEKWRYDALLKDLQEVNRRAVRYGRALDEIRTALAMIGHGTFEGKEADVIRRILERHQLNKPKDS